LLRSTRTVREAAAAREYLSGEQCESGLAVRPGEIMNTTTAWVGTCVVVALAACSGERADMNAKQVPTRSSAEYFGSCENLCGECETYNRCHQPGGTTRYYCVPYGAGCTGQWYVACMCCSDNQIVVGDPSNRHCEDCPAGQVADQLNGGNYCCTPRTQDEV
jgi:hypothetical protein